MGGDFEEGCARCWLPETNPVTKPFWRNRFWASTKDCQLRRFPSRQTRCRCSVIKDQTGCPVYRRLPLRGRNGGTSMSSRNMLVRVPVPGQKMPTDRKDLNRNDFECLASTDVIAPMRANSRRSCEIHQSWQHPRSPQQRSARTGSPSGPKPVWVATHQYAELS